MRISSTRDASDRIGGGLSRVTLTQADDLHFMQEVQIAGYAGEAQQYIEHVHPYGFTAVANPKKRDDTAAAEGFMSFLSGNRSHGVVVTMGDRRFRLFGLANGEVALHDDVGHQVHLSKAGVFVSAPNGKKIVGQVMADSGLPPAPQTNQRPGQQPTQKKMGQGAQAGRQNATSFTLDSNGFTAKWGSGSNAVLARADKDHAKIKHVSSQNAMWVDASGCWTSSPIGIKADPHKDS